jgi:hypothetical protein
LINNQSIVSKEIQEKEIREFVSRNDFGNAAKFLFKHQKSTWFQLREGYESLTAVKAKSFSSPGFEIKIQFNPGRIKSSSAKVDLESINERKCFLCLQNLPEEQKGIIYKDEFLILVNPFPIFPEHFTISSLKHKPQAILENFPVMFSLAKDLSKYYTVFYNGPKCGASAPDHLHFQACTKFIMPLENDLDEIKRKYSEPLLQINNGLIYSVDDGVRKYFVIQSKELPVIERIFNYLYKLFHEVSNTQDEPMMNLILNYEDENWRLIIFLRKKHRPALYDKGILWSPAAVDLGGLCIFPLEKDLNVISESDLKEGFKEVIISDEIFSYIKKKLKESAL